VPLPGVLAGAALTLIPVVTPGGADWLQSSTCPTCKVLMICSVPDPSWISGWAHPKPASLYTQRSEPRGSREAGPLISV